LFFYYNKDQTDLSKTKIGDNLGRDILSTVAPNAILITTEDSATFNTWYVHYVLGVRKDVNIFIPVNVIDPYFAPEREKVKSSQRQLKDPHQIEVETFKLVKKKKRIYSNQPVNFDKDFVWIPRGIVYELMYRKDIPSREVYLKDSAAIWKNLHAPTRKNLLLAERNLTITSISTIYSNGLLQTGDFFIDAYNDVPTGLTYYKKAIDVDDENAGAYEKTSYANFLMTKNCDQTEKDLRNAIFFSDTPSTSKREYANLFYLYKLCDKKERANELKKEYFDVFHESFDSIFEKKPPKGQSASQLKK